MAVLELQDLTVEFPSADGIVRAADRVSFAIETGRTLGVVGESGSGKSVTALSIIGLLDPPGRVTGGRILLNGEDLLGRPEADWLQIRGKRVAMIFQEPASSLNPVISIGEQLREAVMQRAYDAWRTGFLSGLVSGIKRLFRRNGDGRAQYRAAASALLHQVRIPAPDAMLRRYPYMLSGGMLQRVMIAIAIASHPELLIADEPTTALDVTIQAQVLDILRERQKAADLTMLLITHDLGLIAELCDDVVVMYAGQVVERAPVDVLFDAPAHPYTRGLLASMPSLDGVVDRLPAIEGSVPRITGLPSTACHFAWNNRCPLSTEICRTARPDLVEHGAGHDVACHVYSHPAMLHLQARLHSHVWPPLHVERESAA